MAAVSAQHQVASASSLLKLCPYAAVLTKSASQRRRYCGVDSEAALCYCQGTMLTTILVKICDCLQ